MEKQFVSGEYTEGEVTVQEFIDYLKENLTKEQLQYKIGYIDISAFSRQIHIHNSWKEVFID